MRCAIYTRKSADERADSNLSTIENQRDLCEKYVASQAAEGWVALADRYDDLGYSGGTLKRPGLTRLRDDISAGLIDVVVVYKIDRLSRSLADFVRLVSQLEERGVTFVAITQSFDTRTSMGRLTLNVLLSFAQFERELTSERLKDWFAGARARGMWHGPAPYGYFVDRGTLRINEDQAKYIRHVFRRYPVLGSAKEVADEINRMGALNTWGRALNGWQVMRILRNRLYVGDLPHKGSFVPGVHAPIVSQRVWTHAARAIKAMSRNRRPQFHLPPEAPLYPLLHDRHGAPMIHVHYRRRARVYRYYVPSRKRYGAGTSPMDRYKAEDLEQSVIDALVRVGCVVAPDNRPGSLTGALARLVGKIELGDGDMQITLMTGAILRAHVGGRMAPSARTRDRVRALS